MTRAPVRRGHRPGFTLVELMVVILIIAVLAALLTAAVSRALGRGKEVRLQAEISQLATALETFKATYGFYPPSRIILREDGNYQGTQLEQDSLQTLLRMFPRLQFPVNWDGAPNTPGPHLLEGDQCLVFFLGGIPAPPGTPPNCTGFSTNPLNPAAHVGNPNAEVKSLLFEFETGRLVHMHPTSRFYSYLDTYGLSDGLGNRQSGAPYAYFSSYKARNGYNRYLNLGSDCAFLGVWPYAEAPGRYHKPDSFQIISAGPDGVFGTGPGPFTLWTLVAPAAGPGADDFTNFHDRSLGSGN